MAVVYLGYDTALHIYRAIKVLAPHISHKKDLRERFENEARAMAQLAHPNVVAVHDIDFAGDHPYIVMELLRGGTAWEWVLENGPMPPRMAIELLLPVLEALGAAHAAGVIHRDIKPQNILLTHRGRPKVTDFGIARVSKVLEIETMTRTGAVMGTWSYMAPEQRISARDVDGRADVYAIGATLLALIKGESPFDLYAAELDRSLLAGLPDPVADIVGRAGRYAPSDRYADLSEMAEAFQAALQLLEPLPEGVPTLARKLPLPTLGGPLSQPPAPSSSADSIADVAAEPVADVATDETFHTEDDTFQAEDDTLQADADTLQADADTLQAEEDTLQAKDTLQAEDVSLEPPAPPVAPLKLRRTSPGRIAAIITAGTALLGLAAITLGPSLFSDAVTAEPAPASAPPPPLTSPVTADTENSGQPLLSEQTTEEPQPPELDTPESEAPSLSKAEQKAKQMEDKKAEILEKSKLLVGIIGTRGENSSGQTVEDVFADSDGDFQSLDEALAGVGGVELASGGDVSSKGVQMKGQTSRDLGASAPNVLTRGDTSKPDSAKVAAPKASLTLGKIEIGSGESSDAIRGVLRAKQGQIKYCYEKQLKESPKLRGRVVVAVSISGGKVAAVVIDENSTGDSELGRCITSKIRRWRFPAEVSDTIYLPFVLATH